MCLTPSHQADLKPEAQGMNFESSQRHIRPSTLSCSLLIAIVPERFALCRFSPRRPPEHARGPHGPQLSQEDAHDGDRPVACCGCRVLAAAGPRLLHPFSGRALGLAAGSSLLINRPFSVILPVSALNLDRGAGSRLCRQLGH